MEKRIYWFLGLLITGMFCVSCSENEDVSVQRRVTEAESSLNLIAPNGVKIIYMKSNGKTGSLAISDFEY